jgi:hypothetical protein
MKKGCMTVEMTEKRHRAPRTTARHVEKLHGAPDYVSTIEIITQSRIVGARWQGLSKLTEKRHRAREMTTRHVEKLHGAPDYVSTVEMKYFSLAPRQTSQKVE